MTFGSFVCANSSIFSCTRQHTYIQICYVWTSARGGALKTKGKMSITIVQIHFYILFHFVCVCYSSKRYDLLLSSNICSRYVCIACERFLCVTHKLDSNGIVLYVGCHFGSFALRLFASPFLPYYTCSAFHNPCFDTQKGIFIIH